MISGFSRLIHDKSHSSWPKWLYLKIFSVPSELLSSANTQGTLIAFAKPASDRLQGRRSLYVLVRDRVEN